KTSPRTYRCSYEYGKASLAPECLRSLGCWGLYANGIGTSTLYNGDLTFQLEGGILRGRTRFSVHFPQSDGTMATHSEEGEWTGERQDDREDCATVQETVNLLRSRVEADQDTIQGLNTGAIADEVSSFANADDEELHHILIQRLRSGVSALVEGSL